MSIIFSLPAKERIVADLEPEPEEAETCLDFHIDSATTATATTMQGLQQQRWRR